MAGDHKTSVAGNFDDITEVATDRCAFVGGVGDVDWSTVRKVGGFACCSRIPHGTITGEFVYSIDARSIVLAWVARTFINVGARGIQATPFVSRRAVADVVVGNPNVMRARSSSPTSDPIALVDVGARGIRPSSFVSRRAGAGVVIGNPYVM